MAIVGMVAGLVSLVCWILTVVKAFQSGKTSNGILSICPLVGFILGWINVKEWNHQPVMLAWTVATILNLVVQYMGGGAPVVAP